MAITRIKTNQITDLAVTTAKIAANAVTSGKLENNLTYGSDLTVSGNLTVSGTTTSVSTTNTRVEDAIIALAAETSGTPANDAGLLINRGSSDNYAFLWDESADEFVMANVTSEVGDTAGNVTIGSYANLQINNLTAVAPTFSGAVNIDATTASSSTTTGALIVDGGAGVAGALFVGGTFDVASGQTVDFNTNALTNVADPSSAQDAATKAYVDSSVSSGSTLTISDGSATDTVTVGTNTLTFAGTANEVTTAVTDNTVTIGLPDDVTIAGNATVTGNLTVNGTTTTISTTNSVVSDNLIELNNGASSNANDSGIVIERGSTGDNAIFAWDESADVFIVGTTTATGASTGDLTITAAGFTAAAVTADSVAVGGGYGSTGVTISTAGVIQANGALTVDGLSSLDGGIDVNSANFAVSTAGIVTTVEDIRITADSKQLEIGAGTDFTIGHDGTDTTITNSTGILKIDGAASSSIRVNEAGADVDFIIEGDSDTSLFVVDAGNDNVGIGGAANANAIFHVNDTGAMIIATGTTAQRPGTAVTGMFRYNTTTNQLEYYDNDSWESVSTSFTLATSQTFSGDDSTTDFSLSALSGSDSYTVAGILVTLNGVVQEPTTVYGLSGNTLQFTTAPATGDLIEVRKFTTTTTVTAVSDADGDTLIQVEESSDEDKVRIDTGGTERVVIDANGIDLKTGTFQGTATAAQYADLAEMYATDADIEAGTVVHFIGEGKLAPCDTANCRSVAGIVSTDPAYLMNSTQEGAALALAGRVPCKVTGPVAAGDLMVSAGNGMAMANNDAAMGTVIGKAIEANEDGEGVIEVLALMM